MDRITEGVDCISSMPDVILHHILSFIPIGLAIRSSALSRRWRHVWCETPRLDFPGYHPMASVGDINQTLISYKAPKITSFHLCVPYWVPDLEAQIDSWIEFAVSRNVEQLVLSFSCRVNHETYCFPNSFYRSSSLQNLNVDFITTPGCTVSWKSLRSLTLDYCFQSLDDVLSGCPVLETLTLGYGDELHSLDLSKSPTLTILKITSRRSRLTPGSMEIVAPHLRYLDLLYTDHEQCTLVDVSSLTNAKLDIYMWKGYPYQYHYYSDDVKAHFLRLDNMLLKMLAQLRNVELLTFQTTFLQTISLAELHGVPFPKLKVQTLTLHTMITRSVTPGIARLLQSSPALKKLIIYPTEPRFTEDRDLDEYLDPQGMKLDRWRRSKCDGFPNPSNFGFKDGTWYRYLKLVASFIEWLLKNGETLETLVVVFEYLCCSDDATWFEELLRMLPTLSNNNNVSIVLRRR